MESRRYSDTQFENRRFQSASRRVWHEQTTSWERRCAAEDVDIPEELLGWTGSPPLSSLELEERFGDGRYQDRVKRLDEVLESPVFEDETEALQKNVLDVVRWARGRANHTTVWKRGVRENREKLEAKRHADRALHGKRKKLVKLLVESDSFLDEGCAARAFSLAERVLKLYPELTLPPDGITFHGAPVVVLESTGDPLNHIVSKSRQRLLELGLAEELELAEKEAELAFAKTASTMTKEEQEAYLDRLAALRQQLWEEKR